MAEGGGSVCRTTGNGRGSTENMDLMNREKLIEIIDVCEIGMFF